MNEKNVKLFEYFRKVLLASVDGAALPKKPDDISWQSVFGMAKHHSLLTAAYDALRETLKNEASPELIAYLEKQYSIEYARNLTQNAEFKVITELFTKEKIPFLPLKGFLMKALYPKPELRVMADMDIYIGEENAKKARDLLSDIGYTCEVDPDIVDLHDVMVKLPFINVELHRCVEVGSDFGFSSCEPKEENPYWYVMSEKDFFMSMIRHTRKHYIHGGCGVRAILDLYLYKKKNKEFFNAPDFASEFEDDELYEFYKTISDVSDKWFSNDTEITELSEFEIYTLSGGTYGSLENRISKKLDKQSKLSYVISRLFPPPRAIILRYRWVKKCVILLPIGYLVRLVQAIFNGRAKEQAVAVSKANKKKNTKQ